MSDQSGNARAYTSINVVQKKIDKANTVPIIDIFNSYNLNLNINNKAICPFGFHKGGQESSASFYFYPMTNSFFCWGCKTGGGSVDFISKMEDMHRYDAALLILSDFRSFDTKLSTSSSNQNKFHLDFSHSVREFIMRYKESPKGFAYAEHITAAFDDMLSKYHLEDPGLALLVSKLKSNLDKYHE